MQDYVTEKIVGKPQFDTLVIQVISIFLKKSCKMKKAKVNLIKKLMNGYKAFCI